MAEVVINWLETKVRINTAGHHHWPKGQKNNPFWSRWIVDYQLRLCLDGRGWINLRRGKSALKRGSCQWLRAGWDYEIEGDPNKPLEFLTVRFDLTDSSGKRRLNSAGLPPEDLSKMDMDYMEAEMKRIVADIVPHRQGKSRSMDKFGSAFAGLRRMRATARLTALLMEVDELTLDEMRTPEVATHPRVLKLLEIAHRLGEDPGNAPSVEELAREAEYTRAHFCRAFKRVTGLTPQNFLIAWRMRHARKMLLETTLPVKAIAAELGYRDSEFFSRQFHQRTGETPTAFREKNPPLI